MTETGATSENPKSLRLVLAADGALAPRDPYGSPGEHPGYESQDAVSGLFDLAEIWRIFNKRKWLILAIVAAFMAIGAVRTLMETPLYNSTIRIQIDRSASKIVENGDVSADNGEGDFLRTEYERLSSRMMAERVASALNLSDDRDFLRPRGFSLRTLVRSFFSRPVATSQVSNKGDNIRAAAGIVQGNLIVRPVNGSRMVDLTYTDSDPERAQRIAKAYADAYIASNLDKRFEANAYAKTFLEDQLKQLKLRLENSERDLLDFAQKEQIVTVNEKSSTGEANLQAANAALGNLISERIKNEQLWRQVESTPADAAKLPQVPQLLSNNVIDGLRAQRNALVTEYQEKLETFKPSYPAMVQISNKIKEVDRQLTGEVGTIKNTLKAAYQSSLSQENEMKSRIEALKVELLDLQKRSIQYNILEREVDTNRGLYDGLLQRYKEVDVAGGVGANNVFIVDKAEVPGAPFSPNLSRALLMAFALGLGAAASAAFILEKLDDTISTPEQIESISGIATIGIIPKLGKMATIEGELADPRSALSEAYRSLCTAVQFSTENGLPKTLLVTSSMPGEGKSTTSLAMAKHFTALGLKVLLVDADLRNASLHLKLGMQEGIGLSDYLAGNCTPPETFRKTDFANLAFMASGSVFPNAGDLLAGPRLMSLLSLGLEVFDLIVIDGPPVMGLADAPILANATAGTVFVVGAGQGRKAMVRGALRRLRMSRAAVIGSVLTKFDARASGYGREYGSTYGDGYDASAHRRAPSFATPGKRPQIAARQEKI